MPVQDRIGSIEGQVTLLVNKVTGRAYVIGWRSEQLDRVVHSSMGCEALATVSVLGDLMYIEMMLQKIYDMRIKDVAMTDSLNV